jgi:hypothetical protein
MLGGNLLVPGFTPVGTGASGGAVARALSLESGADDPAVAIHRFVRDIQNVQVNGKKANHPARWCLCVGVTAVALALARVWQCTRISALVPVRWC